MASAVKVAICLVLIVQVAAAITCDECFNRCGPTCLDEAGWECGSIGTNTPAECENCKTLAFDKCANPCLLGCRGLGNCPSS